MAQAMQHKPRALLRDLQVLGERDGSDPLRMIGDHPNGRKPLAKRQFGVFEDRPDFDRKALAALAALMRFAVAEMVDFRAAAVRAKLAVAPPDRPQMIDAGLFIREGFKERIEAVEIGDHSGSLH